MAASRKTQGGNENMNGAIEVTRIKAFVQENGIIRVEPTGLLLGRLDGVEYEDIKQFEVSPETGKVVVGADALEHLLNCLDNQKFIHEQNEPTQKEWQR